MRQTQFRLTLATAWLLVLGCVPQLRAADPPAATPAINAEQGVVCPAPIAVDDVRPHIEYLASAEKCAVFSLSELRDEQGRLLRSYRRGEARLKGYLDDYGFLVAGLLALHEATQDDKWLNAARRLTDEQQRRRGL